MTSTTSESSPPPESLTLDAVATLRDSALGQMRFLHPYVMQLMETIPVDDWARIPSGAPTNLAWQVGHLAVAQYGLMLFRQRGRAEGDLELMPGWLRKKYGKGSTPTSDLEESPSQLLEAFQRIHSASMSTVPQLPLESFLEPADMPYAVYPNKLGALLFCPIHESIHAGQIGLLRRLLGYEPIR